MKFSEKSYPEESLSLTEERSAVNPHTQTAHEDESLANIFFGHGRAHSRWQDDCRTQLTILSDCERLISSRSLREKVMGVSTVVRDIVRNCDKDPTDIHEEIGLPAILRRIASTVRDLVPILALNAANENIQKRRVGVEEMLDVAQAKLHELHQRMLNNDGVDMAARAELINRVLLIDPRSSK